MSTETRIGIVAGLLIVVVASVYYFYGEQRADEEILVAAAPRPADPPKIPLSTDKRTVAAPAKPVAEVQAPAKPTVTAQQAPRPAAAPPEQQPALARPAALYIPPAETVSASPGVDKYRSPVSPTPFDASLSGPGTTLLRTSPSPQLVEATRDSLSPSPAAAPPRDAPGSGEGPPRESKRAALPDVEPSRPKVEFARTDGGASPSRRSELPKANAAPPDEKSGGWGARHNADFENAADPLTHAQRKERQNVPASEKENLSIRRASISSAIDSDDPAPSDISDAKKSYVVQEGDTLYGISKKLYGDPQRWTEILSLNKSVLRGDPRRLRPGMSLTLPD